MTKQLEAFAKEIAAATAKFLREQLKPILDRLAEAEQKAGEVQTARAYIEGHEKRVDDLIATLKAIPAPENGRDALSIDILPDIDMEKAYPVGTFATHKGGLWRCKAAVSGPDGWGCIVRGVCATDITATGERDLQITMLMTDGSTEEKTIRMPVMIYRGVWTPEKEFSHGDTVTLGGSLWHCDRPCKEARPGTAEGDPFWTLAVKKGADARVSVRGTA